MSDALTDPPGPRPPPPSPRRPQVPPQTGGQPAGLFKSAPLGRALGTYLSATIAFRLVNYGRVVLLTYWMTRQQFGLLNMILLVVNVLTPLCSLGLNEAVTRYAPRQEVQGTVRWFVRLSFRLVVLVTLVGVAGIIVLSPSLGEFFFAHSGAGGATLAAFKSQAPALTRMTALIIGLLVVYFYLLAAMKGLRMFAALAVMEILHGTLFLAASVGAFLTGHLSALTLATVYAASLAVPVVVFGVGFRRTLAAWDDQHAAPATNKLAGRLLRFSVWATLAGVSWQVLLWYPKWFLGKAHGHEAVAVFTAARQLGQFILIGAVAVSAVVMTTVTKTWESTGKAEARRQLSLAFRGTALGLLTLCAAVALARDLIFLIYPASFSPGAAILPLQLAFFQIAACLALLSIHFQLMEKTRHMLWPWATGVAVNVLLAQWLTGPNLTVARGHPVWQRLAPLADRLFTHGFSDPQGLGGAAWCGVIAMGVALTLCVTLIRAEGHRLDRGSHLVILASLLLTLQSWILAASMVLLGIVAWRTGWVFTTEERGELAAHARETLSHVPWLGGRIGPGRKTG